jgi:hypothetical protein
MPDRPTTSPPAAQPPAAASPTPKLWVGVAVAAAVAVVPAFATPVATSPAFQLGVSLPLVLAFTIAWLGGVRYTDVGWMTAVALALGADAWARLLEPWVPRAFALVAATQLTISFAVPACLLAFCRVEMPSRRLLGVVVAAVVTWGVVCLGLPEELVARFDLAYGVPAWAGLVAVLLAARLGLDALQPLPAKRRRYVGVVVAAAVAAAGARAGLHYGAGSLPRVALALPFGFAAALAVVVIGDLMGLHSDYYKDKVARRSADAGAKPRTARLELGRAVQALLLPKVHTGRHGEFAYEFVYKPAPVIGGDWLYVGTEGDEQRLVFGDVLGSGAQAALGVAAIVSFLHEARGRGLTLTDVGNFLNARLLELFGRQVTTTYQAVSLASDGTVEVANAGGAGFFVASRDGGRHLPLQSAPLGSTPEADVAQEPLSLEDGAVLFAATDGIIDGAHGTRRLLDFLDEEVDFVPTGEGVRSLVLRLAAVNDDDRTLLIVHRGKDAVRAA